MKTFSALTAIALFSTCLHAGAASNTASPVPRAYDVVTLDRGGCFFGGCPSYALRISADGTVEYAGKDQAKVANGADRKLGASALALLSAAMAYVDFDHMRDRYSAEADGCTTLVTDQASLHFSVKRGNKTKTVDWYRGCQGPTVPSRELIWLADTIDWIAKTQDRIAE